MKIDVSLDLYKIFCEVVKTGNMSQAGKELFISQPAVSMSIRQLEEKLGKPLLVRSHKGIKTTAEGTVLYEYLKQGLSLIETAERKYMEMVNLEIGEIKIGAGDTIISQYLMPYLESFLKLHPSINIKVTNRTTIETIKLLKSGQTDIGFVNLPIDHDNYLEVKQCLEINDCLIGGTKFAHLKDIGINITELHKYPLLLLEKVSNSRRFLDKYSETQGVVLNETLELGASDLLLKFARINLGLTIVAREFSEIEIDNKTLFEIPLRPKIPSRGIGLITLKDVVLSHAAQSFVSLLGCTG